MEERQADPRTRVNHGIARRDVHIIAQWIFWSNGCRANKELSQVTCQHTHTHSDTRYQTKHDIHVKSHWTDESAKAHPKGGHQVGLPAKSNTEQPNRHRYATAGSGEASGQTNAGRKKVAGGLGDVVLEQERRLEDLTSLVAKLSHMVEGNNIARTPMTVAPDKGAGIAKPVKPFSSPSGHKNTNPRESQCEARGSSLGAGLSKGSAEYPSVGPNAGEVHSAPSPVVDMTPVRLSPSVGTGAGGNGEVKYEREPILLGDPQNKAAPLSPRDPSGGTNQVSVSPRKSAKPNTRGVTGGTGNSGSSPEVVKPEAKRHGQIGTAHAATGEQPVPSVSDVDEIEKYAEELFNSNSSEAMAYLAGNSPGGEAQAGNARANRTETAHGIASLHAFGFKQISPSEAERAKQKEAQNLGGRQHVTHDAHIDLSGGTSVTTMIPKRRRQAADTTGPTPIPRKVPITAPVTSTKPTKARTAGKRATKQSKPPRTKTAKAGRAVKVVSGSSDGEDFYTSAQIRAIQRRNQKQLAKAVAYVHAKRHEEAAMRLRVQDSQPQPKQKYRQRLRKAVYFDDSDSSEEGTAQFHAGEPASDSSSIDTQVWTHEPKSNQEEIIRLLRKQVEESRAENRALRAKMDRFMNRMGEALSNPSSLNKDGHEHGKTRNRDTRTGEVGHHDADGKVGHHNASGEVGHHGAEGRVGHHNASGKVGHHEADGKMGNRNASSNVEHSDAKNKVGHHDAESEVGHRDAKHKHQ